MAKKAKLPFDDRMFQGHRVRAALSSLNVTTEQFLEALDSVEIERHRKWDDVDALQARLAELKSKAA